MVVSPICGVITVSLVCFAAQVIRLLTPFTHHIPRIVIPVHRVEMDLQTGGDAATVRSDCHSIVGRTMPLKLFTQDSFGEINGEHYDLLRYHGKIAVLQLLGRRIYSMKRRIR